MRIALASDHGGYRLKESLKGYLEKKGYLCSDFGCGSEDKCDYPDYGLPAAEAVAGREYDTGILICKTGIGMSIAANKVIGIRAALCRTEEDAKKARGHNDANILVLSAETGDIFSIAEVWFNTVFEGGRHKRRVDKINAYERREEI